MSDATVHIAAWEAAGTIDRETADRLRAAAVSEPAADALSLPIAPPARQRSAAAELFGPSVTIAEVFGYLGAAFVLGAWSLVMARTSADGLIFGVLSLITAGALVGLGLLLRGRGERGSRTAGVTFFVATGYAVTGTFTFADNTLSAPTTFVIAAAAGVAVAAVLRRIHPAVLTQAGLLTWITLLAQSLLVFVDDRLFGIDSGLPQPGANPAVLVIAAVVFWLVVAVVIGAIGLAEARAGERSGTREPYRRAAISRFWAGMTAVIGVATAVTRSASTGDDYGRVLEPIVGEVILVIISVVLVERAFRRGATSFMYAAALGLILALTDFNVNYLSDSTEVALLVEGLILLGVGFVAYRLRDRIGDDTPNEATAAA